MSCNVSCLLQSSLCSCATDDAGSSEPRTMQTGNQEESIVPPQVEQSYVAFSPYFYVMISYATEAIQQLDVCRALHLHIFN